MKRVIVVAALFGSAAANAQSDWVPMTKTADHQTVEVDNLSVEREGDYVTFWDRITNPRTGEVSISHVRIYCATNEFAIGSSIRRNRLGRTISSTNGPDQYYSMEVIFPESVIAGEKSVLCSKK